MKFKILWGIDVLITLVVLYFFLLGLADGSVSAFNAGLWFAILVGLGMIMAGSLWLRSSGRPRSAMALLFALAVPGLLAGAFLLIVLITNPRWN